MDFAAGGVMRDVGSEPIDNVTGGETVDISFAAWLAGKLNLPMHGVREKKVSLVTRDRRKFE